MAAAGASQDGTNRAFAVFQGGGAKGLAHVGAIAAAEDQGVVFCGVAGASAGAIVAALVAAGYRAGELYDPATRQGLLAGLDFVSLLEPRTWRRFAAAKRALGARGPDGGARARRLWRAARQLPNALDLGLRAVLHRGLFSTAAFERWLDAALAAKTGLPRPVRFRDLFALREIPLKIIAVDIRDHAVVVFDARRTPDVPVAAAVGASASIPLFFRPRALEVPGLGRRDFSDGGVKSNLPAWVLDAERTDVELRAEGPLVPTLCFRLVSKRGPYPASGFRSLDFLTALASTAVGSDYRMETRQVENLHLFELPVDVGTTDLDLAPAARHELYQSGRSAARRIFAAPEGPKDPARMRGWLRWAAHEIVASLEETFGAVLSGRPLDPRANLFVRTHRDTLRIRYAFAMEGESDTDDRLELLPDGGITGRLFSGSSADPLLVLLADLQRVEAGQNMSKYQRALVRRGRTLLVSARVPRLVDVQWGGATLDPSAPLGVLNVDFGPGTLDGLPALPGPEETSSPWGPVIVTALRVAREAAVRLNQS